MPRLGVVREDIRAGRQETADRYANWLADALRSAGWSEAELSRRSGISRQKINEILQREGRRPTALQVGGFARAFDVEPGVILQAIGMWEAPSEGRAAYSDLEQEFLSLSFPARRFLLDTARGIKRIERFYRGDDLPAVAEAPAPYGPDDEPTPLFTPLPGEPSAALHNDRGEIVTEDNAPGPVDEE